MFDDLRLDNWQFNHLAALAVNFRGCGERGHTADADPGFMEMGLIGRRDECTHDAQMARLPAAVGSPITSWRWVE
jgi:hypothetical protein